LSNLSRSWRHEGSADDKKHVLAGREKKKQQEKEKCALEIEEVLGGQMEPSNFRSPKSWLMGGGGRRCSKQTRLPHAKSRRSARKRENGRRASKKASKPKSKTKSENIDTVPSNTWGKAGGGERERLSGKRG